MKFYPPSIVRFCFRYLWIIIFVGLPLWFSTPMFWDVVEAEDIMAYIRMCWIIAACGAVMTHFFWEKFFSVLILTDDTICWKCPFRKTKRLTLAECVEIGAYTENANNGIPSEQIYFSDYICPIEKMDKNGIIKASEHLIKFPYSDALSDYIMSNYPGKLTDPLSEFRRQRKM